LVAEALDDMLVAAMAELVVMAIGRPVALANKQAAVVPTAAQDARFVAPQGMSVATHTRSGIRRTVPCLLQAISSRLGHVQVSKGSLGPTPMTQPWG
jgi:hypothetical protein